MSKMMVIVNFVLFQVCLVNLLILLITLSVFVLC